MKRYISTTSKKKLRSGNLSKKKTAKSNFTGFVNFNYLIAGLIVVFSLAYLIQVNNISTQGYKIKDLEKTVAELKTSKSELELAALDLQSVAKIQEKMNELGMVSLNGEEFINAKPVAVNR